MPFDAGAPSTGGDGTGAFLGSPGNPVCCAIGSLRDLPVDHLLELHGLGVDFFQLRDREVSDRDFEAFLTLLAREAPAVPSRVLVNDRLALAAVFPVAGVHLPETGLPVAAVRARFPRGRMLIGRSVHGLDAALAAEREGADYVILGPVAPTGDKRPLPPAVLPEVCGRLRIPVWAVGGLTPDNLDLVRGAGVSGLAAIRSFSNPRRAAALVAARSGSWPERLH